MMGDVGPCTFAYMAPVLGVTFKLGATSFLYGAALLLAYGVGQLRAGVPVDSKNPGIRFLEDITIVGHVFGLAAPVPPA